MEFKKHWDLITVIVLSIIVDVLILQNTRGIIQEIAGLTFVLFLPGYVLIAVLFPEKRELSNLERIALSFGLSIAVVPLIGLGLNFTPWGVKLKPLLVSLTAFNTVFAILAVYQRSRAVEPWTPFTVKEVTEKLGMEKPTTLDKTLSVILIISIILSLGILTYVASHPKPGEKLTEFYILGPEGKASNYPTNLRVGQKGIVVIGIVNHEGRNVTYYVQIWLVNLTWDDRTNTPVVYEMYPMPGWFNVTLPPVPVNIEGNWTPEFKKNYTFSIDKPGKWQIWFLLFKDRPPELPQAPANGNYAETGPKNLILDAMNGRIQSLKLNVEVKEPVRG
ncbi:DUF1616 domain-containing protein [Thermococcus sp.]